MLLTNTLSCLPGSTEDTIEMDMWIGHHGFTSDRIEQLKRGTTADPTLGLVYEFTLNGWLDSRRCLPHIAQRYWD